MELEFLSELYEARMTRNSGDTAKLTYNDCCERLYLTLLVLELLSKYPKYMPYAKAYAKKTKDVNYKRFQMHGTDLHNFIYFVNGDDEALAKLKDPDSARMVARRTTLPLNNINRYLTTLSQGLVSRPNETFMSIESALKISNADYKATRRYLQNFSGLNTFDKKKVATRLAIASRAKLRSSDIIIYMEELLAERDLETRSVKDNEPTISSPDIAVTGPELSYYRFLVGARNLVGTKKFLELARSGNSIPSTFVKQYLPAIQLIDDIVKAGPGYVQMLRSLQKRAKKRR
tara:strand:- start:531 stop:1397 length:867 start_codon:yes stop_codon:yes gene_type:complete